MVRDEKGEHSTARYTTTMSNKIILVTGANRGIGLSIVQALAQRSPGLCLLVASRSIDNANTAVRHLKDSNPDTDFHAIELDVSSDKSVKAAVQMIKCKFGKLDGKSPPLFCKFSSDTLNQSWSTTRA